MSTVLALALTLALLVIPRAEAVTTNGSGGSFTNRTFQSFTASNGLSSRYHVYADGLDRTKSVGLMVQFHGDGAYEFNNPDSSYSLGGREGLRAQAREHNMILLVALAPDQQGSVTWWESGSANADYARDLIDTVAYRAYPIDTERTWLIGYSGGAQFVTQFLLPKHSSLFDGGGSVVFGGGGVPRVTPQPFAAGLTADFPMYWYTGAADTSGFNALRHAQQGSAYYADRGFRTTLDTPAGVGHSLSGRFGPVTGAVLDAYDIVGPAQPDATPTPSPSPTVTSSPSPTPTVTLSPTPDPEPTDQWAHTIDPRAGYTRVVVDVPSGATRTTVRVDSRPIAGQTGTYLYTYRSGQEVRFTFRSLRAGRTYYYQIENGNRREVVASGTFTVY